MSFGLRKRVGGRTIRVRILMIAWMPSLALLLIGGTISGYLAYHSYQAKQVGSTLRDGTSAGRLFIPAFYGELQASAAVIADPQHSTSDLQAKRARTDAVLSDYASYSKRIGKHASAQYNVAEGRLMAALGGLPALRERVNNGQASLIEAESYYGQVVALTSSAVSALGRSAPDAHSAIEEMTSQNLVNIGTAMSQSNALAYAAFSDAGMNSPQYEQFLRTAGSYRQTFATYAADLPSAERKQAQALMSSKAWNQQLRVEQAVLVSKTPVITVQAGTNQQGTDQNGVWTPVTSKLPPNRFAQLPISRKAWEAASNEVATQLTDIAVEHTAYGASLAAKVASKELREAYLAGGSLLVFAIIVLLLTTRESNKLIDRLRRLRGETMELAQTHLPLIVSRLQDGETVDVSKEMPPLQYGRDEIGQVADAFGYAQRVAVQAAVQEADTRAGLRSVFLNIAYRSQVIVHRQLKVLERAEQFEEDPEQLKLLFELDHLSTRARRNAENLVILGGGQPGRQWRQPVPLLQVVRGAISEAEDYARVSVGALPRLAINGNAVADVIHLLAEIVDNATSFSPPMSRVEVRGNQVGRGLVLEIEDQGLGIPEEQLAQFNEMMLDPPDFQALSLREEPRLGMFVVAQLAQSQGIRVTLTPSPAYGGTKVVVLLPTPLLDTSSGTQTSRALAESAVPAPIAKLSAGKALTGKIPTVQTPAVEAPAVEAPAVEAPAVEVPVVEVPSAPGPTVPVPTGPVSAGPMSTADASTAEAIAKALAAEASSPTVPSMNTLHERMAFQDEFHPGTTGEFALDTNPGPLMPPPASARNGRPALPRRSRQTHLSDRLRSPQAAPGLGSEDLREPAVTDPEEARNRMAAFQRGTRRGRSEDPDESA